MSFNSDLERFRRYLKATADSVVHLARSSKQQHVDDDELGESFMTAVKEMEAFDAESQKLVAVIQSLTEELKESDQDVPTPAKFKQLYDKMAKKKQKELVPDTAHYKNVRKNIKETLGLGDEVGEDETEMEVMQVQHSRKDPISKKDIVNPVIYEACGHVYDRDSIHDFAAKKKTIKCAIQGCSETITIKNLVDYPEYWNNIKQHD